MVKQRITRDVTQLVLARKPQESNFLEYQGKISPNFLPSFKLIRASLRFQGDLSSLRVSVFRVWRDGR